MLRNIDNIVVHDTMTMKLTFECDLKLTISVTVQVATFQLIIRKENFLESTIRYLVSLFPSLLIASFVYFILYNFKSNVLTHLILFKLVLFVQCLIYLCVIHVCVLTE